MAVRYFVQIIIPRFTRGPHVKSRTLKLRACLGELHAAPDPENQLRSKTCQPNTTSSSSSTVDLLQKNGGAGPNSMVFME
jgi:hypothetical protein